MRPTRVDVLYGVASIRPEIAIRFVPETWTEWIWRQTIGRVIQRAYWLVNRHGMYR